MCAQYGGREGYPDQRTKKLVQVFPQLSSFIEKKIAGIPKM
jgi:hypothetical protein